MKIGNKPDTSYLFASLSNNKSTQGVANNFNVNLSDYALIKSGTYGKLMKAHFAKEDASEGIIDSEKNDKVSKKELSEVKNDAESLKNSADKLMEKGNGSLFSKKDINVVNEDGTTTTTYDYDKEAIAKGVEQFITDYNQLIKSGGDSKSDDVLNKTLGLVHSTKSFKDSLSRIGITINADNTLVMDKEMFEKAEVLSIKSVFNDRGSFGNTISTKANFVEFTASNEISNFKNYDSFGNKQQNNNTGNIFSDYI